jgi:serine protease Do
MLQCSIASRDREIGVRLTRLAVRWSCATAAVALLLLQSAAPTRAADHDLSLDEQDAFKAAVDRAAPSVVKIETIGGLEHIGNLLIGTGPTTGVAVSPDGYIISSAFNFVQKPAETLVELDDKTRLPALVVATDHSRMLVLLKVKMPAGRKLTVPTAVRKSEMVVGQWSLALGRTFDGTKPSMSVGIISALNRVWSKAIQTDAKVSPNNYGGPLVDIRGRVLGVLVPMSPMGRDGDLAELAGVEWYDSGIGFAIPLEDINRALPRLKKGKDLHAGLLGISMKPGDVFADAAKIVAVRPNSPAYHAGLKADDEVVAIDGHQVKTQVQLKHQLGPHYAGDKVRVVVLRGKQRIEKSMELTDKLEPYVNPFIGILPMRPLAGKKESEPGVVVRYVYPDSPAAKAGVKIGDRLTEIAGKPVANIDAALAQLATFSEHDKARVAFRRGDKTLELDIQFARLPEEAPAELPPAHEEPTSAAKNQAKVGTIQIRIPESPNKCVAFVPESYNPQLAYGVVLWLQAPGNFKDEDVVAPWKDICNRHDLILVAPQSSDPARWERTELDFIRRALDDVVAKYHIDRNRIVAAGQEGGGAMAFLLAQNNRDWIRAVAAVDGAMPAGSQVLPNDPVARLAFYIASSEKSPAKNAIEATVDALQSEKYPVTLLDLGPTSRGLSAPEFKELGRWIDSLDRL